MWTPYRTARTSKTRLGTPEVSWSSADQNGSTVPRNMKNLSLKYRTKQDISKLFPNALSSSRGRSFHCPFYFTTLFYNSTPNSVRFLICSLFNLQSAKLFFVFWATVWECNRSQYCKPRQVLLYHIFFILYKVFKTAFSLSFSGSKPNHTY